MEEMETTGLEPVTCRLWADRSANWAKFPEQRAVAVQERLSAVAVLSLTAATKGLRLLISAFCRIHQGAFEAPLIIPVGIDGTNSEGNYIMAKQYSPTGLAGFEPANTAIKMLCLTDWR